jgi:uncharacterized protein YkuJ
MSKENPIVKSDLWRLRKRRYRFFNFERRGNMSQLQGIISRLKSLQETAASGEPAQRFFEVNGERKCQVTYHPKTETYELEVYNEKEKPKKYQFDNIDMITIEIFDLIQ